LIPIKAAAMTGFTGLSNEKDFAMSYVSIVAATSGAPDDTAVISAACDLAKRHGAMVRVVIAVPQMVPITGALGVGGGMMSPQVWEYVDESWRRLVEFTTAIVEDQAARHGLASGARDTPPYIVVTPQADTPWLALQRELPLADLVIAARSSSRGEGPWTGLLSDALIASRSPVLIPSEAAHPAGALAAVAWDGSPEAGRAVRAAVPMLQLASKVAILQNPDELDISPGAAADPGRLTRYLAAQGVKDISLTRLKDGRTGPALLGAAESLGAALLVAGGFGHGRLAEAIFGGATKTFLDAKEGPHVFLCH
jgi:nucleotide-binding universal stress UspA family protein